MPGKIKRLARIVHFIMKLRRLVALLSHAPRECGLAVPRDVKAGHFAVLAGNGEERKRFVVGLHHLKNPEFARLLDKAGEEYGFKHDGLLVIPCLPDELEKLLEDGV